MRGGELDSRESGFCREDLLERLFRPLRHDLDRAARAQRYEQGSQGQIERRRREQRHPDSRVAQQIAADMVDVLHDTALAHGYALGSSRAAGGVDEIGELACSSWAARRARSHCDELRLAVQHERIDPGRQHAAQRARRQDARGLRVGQQEGEPLCGMLRIERQECAPRLEHREHGDHVLDRTLEKHADDVFGPDSGFDQPPRQLFGAHIERSVGERLPAMHDGRRIGRTGDLPLEQIAQGDVRDRSLARLEPGTQLGALRCRQNIDPRHARLGVVRHAIEYPQELLDDRFRRCASEQLCCVVELGGEAGTCLGEREREVELRGAHRRSQHRSAQARKGGHRNFLCIEGEQSLKQRLPAERARRIQNLDEALERQILVLVRLQASAARALQKLGECRIAAGIHPQYQRVDEAADEPVERLVRAPGHWGAQRHIRSGSELHEQRAETRLQQHEQRRAAGTGKISQARRSRGRNDERDRRAGKARGAGARPVDRQGQLDR